MAIDQVRARVNDLQTAINHLESAVDNCPNEEERGFLIVGLNRLQRQKVNLGVPGARNCSPLLGAQIGEYKICTFLSSQFYRDIFGYSGQDMCVHSSTSLKGSRRVFIRRTLEANESKPDSRTQYLYLLRCASGNGLGVFQSSYSICRKLLILGARQPYYRSTSRLLNPEGCEAFITCEEYSRRVLENLVELGAAEKNDQGLYRLI